MSPARLLDWLRQDSRWIPACFVAFFGVVIAVNGIMVWAAVTTWTGVIDRAYDRGLHYNAKLEAARAQQALGWDVELAFTPNGAREGWLWLSVADRDGNGVERALAHARFERPTHEGFDFLVALEPQPGGGYGAPVELPLAGLWGVRIQLDRGEVSYRFSERILVR